MPIVTSDLKIRLSTTAGSAGNTTAGTIAGSLGKYISTTDVVDATANNVFDDISGDENAASTVEYRCLFIYNAHGTLALQSPVLWLSAEVAGGADLGLAWDSTAPSAVGSATAQALSVASETTAPAALSFSAPTTKATGLAMGANLSAGQVKGFWLRRTATNSSPVTGDGGTFRIEGDTAA